ncbi:hypothetical protein H6800_02170 [Candidatus Nomurabacteria bacterium]|nr:hypothetical protein [Candidatus Nomurabacteria bacterium]
MEPDNINNDNPHAGLPTESNLPTQSPQTLQPQPAQNSNNSSQPNKPGIIVLQWLTYAFWGWTIVALGTLLGTTVSYLIDGADTGGFTPYGIAAVLVLLPISAVCDLFYSKYEPTKKTGAASVVMVIHAVIFALLAIGSLIAVVFSLISLVTSGSESKQTHVAIITALSLSIIYSITFLRTLHPAKLKWLSRVYLFVMLLVSSTVIVLGIVGPVNNERLTKTDKLFTNNASVLKHSIDSYATKNSDLPKSLKDIDSKNPNVNALVNSQLLDYTPNVKKKSLIGGYTSSKYLDEDSQYYNNYTYYYQLCFKYSKSDTSPSSYYSDSLYNDEKYVSYINTYGHEAGKVCYNLKTGY